MESATTKARNLGPVGAVAAGAATANGRPAEAEARAERSALDTVRDYIALTKPRIISLLLLTTVATMVVAAPEGLSFATIMWTMVGGYLAAGGAGAINHYLDRDRDARMARTRSRPLVAGRIEPVRGLVFGVVLGVIAAVQLTLTVNALAAALSMVGCSATCSSTPSG